MRRIIIALGAINAFLAIAFGAFAAHALKTTISEHYLAVFHTGASYHMYHALGMLLVGSMMSDQTNKDNRALTRSAILMQVGIVLFSCSLYALSLTAIKWLGMITPIGGVSFMLAWLVLAWSQLKSRPAS
jgi:uncharacterized membrane protein YgdD (TMEM256/DUF423 family)